MNHQPENIKIRIAHNEDAATIALLGRITFGETFAHLFRDPDDLKNYFDNTFSVQKIEDGLTKKNNVFWLAFVDKLPVGYAKLKLSSSSPFLKDPNSGQLQKIYVLKEFLSLKIGTMLQQELLKTSKQKNIKNVWLSVLDSNERALKFYRKNGFSEIGRHNFHIGKEHFEFLVLAKLLN